MSMRSLMLTNADNTPVTIISSEGAFVTTSRRLARRIIKQHCEDRLPIPVSTFADTGDKAWSDYEHQKKGQSLIRPFTRTAERPF